MASKHVRWSTTKLLAGTVLIGSGLFNLVEGIVDQWTFWGVGFLIWGAAMLIGGWLLLKVGQCEEVQEATDASPPLITSVVAPARGAPNKTHGQLDGVQRTGLAHPGEQLCSGRTQAARRLLSRSISIRTRISRWTGASERAVAGDCRAPIGHQFNTLVWPGRLSFRGIA